MQEAVPTGGAMCAVLGMDGEKIAKICDETEGIVSVANYNCPGQIVITGEEGAVAVAVEKLKEAGARRCIPLNVSGPFHSAMLKEAGEKLGKVLEQVELRAFSTPYVTNVTAEYVTEPSEIQGTAWQTGVFFCEVAAECGTDDCGWCGYVYRDRTGKNTDGIFEENQ